MGDRDGTVMLGVMADSKFSDALSAQFRYEHDLLGKIGGGKANARLRRTQQIGNAQWYAGIGLEWLSSTMSRHEFGVPLNSATAIRAAYAPNNVTSFQTELGAFISIKSNWRLQVSMQANFYNNEAKKSPIVDEDHALNLFTAISYAF